MIVDTSVWVDFFNGLERPALELALKEGRVLLTPLVAAELMSGPRSPGEIEKLENFIKQLGVMSCDLDHWIRVGRLRAKMIKAGLTLSTPDAHIAQCALDQDGSLYSHDKIFKKIAAPLGLRLVEE